MAWPLLVDVCATLRPGATAGAAGVPVLLTASGCGAQLAALVRSKLQGLSGEAAGDEAAAAEAWAALACLPHAAENAAQAAACCAALAAATAPADDDMEQDGGGSAALLMLHCGALGAQAALLAASGQEGDGRAAAALLPQAVALLVRHPGNYHAVAAAAEVLQAAAAGGADLSTQQLQELVPLLAPNLSAASQPLRRETLRALCCFRMPAMLPPAGSGALAGLGWCASSWGVGAEGAVWRGQQAAASACGCSVPTHAIPARLGLHSSLLLSPPPSALQRMWARTRRRRRPTRWRSCWRSSRGSRAPMAGGPRWWPWAACATTWSTGACPTGWCRRWPTSCWACCTSGGWVGGWVGGAGC